MQALLEGAKVYGDADAVQKLVGNTGEAWWQLPALHCRAWCLGSLEC